MTTTTPTLWSDELLVSASDRAWASSIAALADGGFAVVWNDYPTDIFGQQFTAVGAKTGIDFLAGISVNAAQAWDTVQHAAGRAAFAAHADFYGNFRPKITSSLAAQSREQ